MADPTDLNEVIDKTEALSAKIEKLTQLQQNQGNVMSQLISGLGRFGTSSKEAANFQETLADKLRLVGDVAEELSGKTFGFLKNIDVSGVLGGMSESITSLLGLSKSFGSLTSPIRETDVGISILTGALSHFGSIGKLTAEGIANLNNTMKELKASHQIARQAIVESGQSLLDANKIIADYPQNVRVMSAETKFGVDAINAFNKEVGIVLPSSLRMVRKDIIGLGGGFGEMIQPSVVALAALKAFGMEGASAGQFVRKAFYEFNQTGLETAQNMGILARAAQGAGVDFEKTQEQVMRASTPLAIFGRKVSESTGIWKVFTETLRAGNVPIAEVWNIVENVTRSIATMSFENRAFIGIMSGMTRGASALGGALKLEFAMRQEGGMQKNLDALTGTLAKFAGGKIITLEQAATNPQLEQQFVLQRQMLGKLGIQGTAEQQNRMLEVLQKVQSGGIAAIDADKAMKDIYEKGKDLQERSLTIQEKIFQATRAIAVQLAGTDEAIEALDKTLEEKVLWREEGKAAVPAIHALEARAGKDIGREKEENETRARRARIGASIGLGFETPNIMPRQAVMPPETFLGRAVEPPTIRPPVEPALRARVPENVIPSIANLNSTIGRGDSQTHRHLQQLIEATRSGFTSLHETRPPAAPTARATEPLAPGITPTASTLLIRFEGNEPNVIERVKKAVEESFGNSMLGIRPPRGD